MNDDTISRAAAIDAVKKNTFRLTFAEEQNCEGHVAWSANAVYSDVIEGALLELPSAQPDVPGTNVGDMVNRAAAIDILDAYQVMVENGEENPYAWARLRMSELPSAQPEHMHTVMLKIKEKYEKAMNTPCINNPIAWALYQTWKEYDR